MPEMATRQDPETETSRHRYAADLARWDNEGGAPAPLASEAVSEASQGTRSSLDHRNDATLSRRQRVMAGRRTARLGLAWLSIPFQCVIERCAGRSRHLSQIWNLLSCQASPMRAPCLHIEVTHASVGVATMNIFYIIGVVVVVIVIAGFFGLRV